MLTNEVGNRTFDQEHITSLFDEAPKPALLAEVASEPPVVEEGPETFDMSLDDLMAESLEKQSEAASIKAAKSRLAKEGDTLNASERAELQARVEAWEMRHVWEVKAAVAVFHRTICKGCEAEQSIFRHFMHRAAHRTNPGVQRWFRVWQYDWNLPREVIYTEAVVPVCGNCAQFEGFELLKGEVFEHGSF